MNSIPSMVKQGEFEAKLQGVIFGEAAPNALTIFEWVTPYDRLMNGCQYQAEGRNIGDNITFQVVHPVAGVVKEFGTNWYVKPEETILLYRAHLYAGLTVRVKYNNIGSNPVKFTLNLFLHEKL